MISSLFILNETFTNGYRAEALDLIFLASILSGLFVVILVSGINFKGLSYLLVSIFFLVNVIIHLTRVFNFLVCGLSNPPRPYAFASLPLQSSLIGWLKGVLYIILYFIISPIIIITFFNLFTGTILVLYFNYMPRLDPTFIEWLNTNLELVFKSINMGPDGAGDDAGNGNSDSDSDGAGDYQHCDGFQDGQNPDGYDTMLPPLDPVTGLDPSVQSEVPSGNVDCSHNFNHDPYGGVQHGHKDTHDWYHEAQQKYESLDCKYCDKEAVTQSVNDKVICNSCDKAAHLECIPANSSEDPNLYCRNQSQGNTENNSN